MAKESTPAGTINFYSRNLIALKVYCIVFSSKLYPLTILI